MTQSEASANFLGSSFPYGGSSGLSLKREEERENARRRRALQLPRAEADALPLPHFPQPRKVQAPNKDPLVYSIKATLGDYKDIEGSMRQRQHLLLGIGQVPQTPVEGTGQKAFNFDGKQSEKKDNAENGLLSKLSTNLVKSEKSSRTHKSSHRTTHPSSHSDKSKPESSKSEHKTSTTHVKKSPSQNNRTSAVDQHKKSPSNQTSSHDSKSSSSSSSAATKEVTSNKDTTAVTKDCVSNKDKEKGTKEHHLGDVKAVLSKLKEKMNKHEDHKEPTAKPKPPKLSITKGSSLVETTEEKTLGEDPSLEKILEEMTQPSIPDPPLTGIQTPLKDSKDHNRFAFPQRIIQKHSPIRTNGVVAKKKDEATGLLEEDLILSDSEDDSEDEKGNSKPSRPRKASTSSSGSSSEEDSDSDSSDSDSDSSDDDKNSPVNSPTKKSLPSPPAKLSNGGRTWGLGDLQKALINDTANQPPTTTSGPKLTSASLDTVGGEGLRGNQAAPAANTKSSLNTTMDHDLPDPLADAEDHVPLFDALPELPDFSSSILESNEMNGLDELSHDVSNDLLNSHLNDSNNVVHSINENKNSPKPTENGHITTFKLPKGNKKDSSKRHSEIAKTPKEKTSKEKEEKALKAAAKNKKAAESAKSRIAEKEVSNSSSHTDKSHSTKCSSKKSSFEKSGSEKSCSEKSCSERSSSEKPSSEKFSSEKPSSEKSSSEKSSSEKSSSDKTSSEKSSGKKKASSETNVAEKKHKLKAKLPVNSNKSSVLPKPASDGESDEIDVVTVSYDRPLLSQNSPSHEVLVSKKDSKNSHSKHSKTKPLMKGVNGVKTEHVNGKMTSPLSHLPSPKNGLTNGEISVDTHTNPDSLVVKIDLALLKRVPRLPGTDSVVIKLKNAGSPAPETNGGWECMSPARGKIPKRHLSIELDGDVKKPKPEPETKPDSSTDIRKKVKSHDKKDRYRGDERRSSSSSTFGDKEETRRKRSPSRDGDRHAGKRRRHEDDHAQEKDHGMMNGWEHANGEGVHEQTSNKCSCSEKIKEVEAKRDRCLERLYQSEPKVPHGPDFYLQEAKRVKHRADAIKDHTARAHKYFEAVLYFVRCARALEQSNDLEAKSAYQMYVETIEMLKYAMRLSMNKSEKNPDKRFLALCMRLESLLYMRLFKLRKDGLVKGSKLLMEHFKAPPKCPQAPSPYNASNAKTTGTPSPMSPTPSPSGSIGSIGSVGSTGSNEAMTTPSRTGKLPSSAMTSPVNATIPQKIHAMTGQHLGFTNHMIFAFDVWEQSQNIFNDYREFFMDLDRSFGPVTLHSTISHVVEYVDSGYKRLKDSTQTH